MFADSDDLDACPKLRARPQGRLSAMCVPVSIMGRTVGVIHATGEPGVDVPDNKRQDLTTLAKLAGARIGLLRVMAETQLQASTDTLTGLFNRRSFSEQVATIPKHMHPVAMAMADLDHFKSLNDTYGHETGDRALRLFARVMRDSLRTSDLISRYGGEEFAVAFPDCSAIDAVRALDTVRAQLDAAITVGGLPKFTVSFGITDMEPGEELAAALRRADDALLLAKRQGRDRVMLNDPLVIAGAIDAEGVPNGNGDGTANGTAGIDAGEVDDPASVDSMLTRSAGIRVRRQRLKRSRPRSSRRDHTSENVPACTITRIPIAQRSMGTATEPSLSRAVRARGCLPRPEHEGSQRDLAHHEDTGDRSNIGAAADSEEWDVGGQVVASSGNGDQRGGSEAATDRAPAEAGTSGGRLARGGGLCTIVHTAPSTRPQPEEPVYPDGERDEAEEADHPRGELEQQRRRRSRSRDEGAEAEHLSRRNAVRPFQGRTGNQGRGHDAVVDVGPDERQRSDADVGRQAGRRDEEGDAQVAGRGMAGPKGLSPRRVTRWA